jgi:hypothetical protein
MKHLLSIILLATAAPIVVASPAAATVLNYELTLTANHAGWVPLLTGAPTLGYTTAPIGEVFKGSFSLDSDLLVAGTTNEVPLLAFSMAAGTGLWSGADVKSAYFVTDSTNAIVKMGLFVSDIAGNAFSLGYKTGRPNLDTIISFWSVSDNSMGFGACAISTDFTFSGPCFGSVNNDVVLTRLADGVEGGVDNPPAVPEPASWAMMLFGLGSAAAVLRHRSRAPKPLLMT